MERDSSCGTDRGAGGAESRGRRGLCSRHGFCPFGFLDDQAKLGFYSNLQRNQHPGKVRNLPQIRSEVQAQLGFRAADYGHF